MKMDVVTSEEEINKAIAVEHTLQDFLELKIDERLSHLNVVL